MLACLVKPPYNIFNNCVVKQVIDLGVSINKRAMACSLVMGNVKYLVFNVYLPCWQAVMYDAEVGIICGFMQTVVSTAGMESQHIIVAGDFNVNPSKAVTSESAVSDLYKFVNDYGLVSCAGLYKSVCTHTFRCVAHGVYSWLDDVYIPQVLDYKWICVKCGCGC